MHVIEHVGLGRYGDTLDANGDLKALAELRRVLAPGGSLLVVVPIGKPRVCFNAHRVYAFDDVLHALRGLALRDFALIPDSPEDGGLVTAPPASLLAKQVYGCGCFWFQAPSLGRSVP
jgi:SAM-dependent methyltransferase